MNPTFEFKAPIKERVHKNPDGSSIIIRTIEIDERSFWDELTSEWIKFNKGTKSYPKSVSKSI